MGQQQTGDHQPCTKVIIKGCAMALAASKSRINCRRRYYSIPLQLEAAIRPFDDEKVVGWLATRHFKP
jgi:hypothetical protein